MDRLFGDLSEEGKSLSGGILAGVKWSDDSEVDDGDDDVNEEDDDASNEGEDDSDDDGCEEVSVSVTSYLRIQ